MIDQKENVIKGLQKVAIINMKKNNNLENIDENLMYPYMMHDWTLPTLDGTQIEDITNLKTSSPYDKIAQAF